MAHSAGGPARKLAALPTRRRRARGACLVALTTVPSLRVARRLARTLVGERLCACVNIVPGLRSIYRWEGRVREEGEVLLILKTSVARGPRLRARLVALHPYAVAELVSWRATATVPAYARWLADATS
jgi:periplasmic divalent cation tolerance protein